MSNKLTLDEIQRYFSYEIFKRGRDYYQEGRVIDLREEGYTLNAIVEDKDNFRYNISIRFERNKEIKELNCNCAYTNAHCKHTAAALIYYILNGPIQKIELKNPLTNQNHIEKEEQIISILPNKTKNLINNTNSLVLTLNQLDNPAGYNNNNDHWKLIFIISQAVNFSSYKDWNISLGMQYVKIDQTSGRITRYQEQKLTEQILPNELPLFYHLLNKYEHKDSLIYHLDTIINDPTLPVFLLDRNTYKPIILSEINKTEIFFRLQSLNLKSEEFFFIPEVVFSDTKGNSVSVNENHNFPSIHGNLIFLIFLDGRILYKKSINLFPAFINQLLTVKVDYQIEEISYVQNFINKHLSEEIILHFNKKNLKIIHPELKPVAELADEMNQTTIRLYYKYLDKIIPAQEKSPVITISGEKECNEILIIERNLKLERDINEYFFNKIKDDVIYNKYNTWYDKQTYDVMLNTTIRDFLIKYGKNILDDGFEIKLKKQNKTITNKKGNISIAFKSNIDWLELETYYQEEDGKIKNIEIDYNELKYGLLRTKENYIILTDQDINKLLDLVNDGLDEKGRLKFSKLNFSLIDQYYQEISNNQSNDILNILEIFNKLKNFNTIENQKAPVHFNGTLRNYQKAGYNWLYFLNLYQLNGCLADDMGLGKTIQALALLQKLKEENKLNTVLLIVPVTTLANWESEIKRFTPDLNYTRHYGLDRNKTIEPLTQYDIIISSYHTIRNDIELFKDFEFEYLILDEAQNIKNFNTQIFKAIKLLHAKHRLLLTGTPIENNTLELWTQFNILHPELLGSLKDFKKKYAEPIEVHKNKDALEKLKKTIFPFILRRKKNDVATDLPSKEEIIFYTEMSPEQKKLYEQLKTFYRDTIAKTIDDEGINKSSFKIFEALLRLRQAALFPTLISEEYQGIKSCKFEELKEMINEIITEDHKILIFSQFVQVLTIIKGFIKESKIQFSYLDGSTKNREQEIKKFQEDENTKIFLLSLKAGGTGINLTASDYVFIFDPWWNPAVENQAIDRSHRIGQTKKVIVYKLIVKDTVEEKILKLQERKKNLVSDLITEETTFFKNLSRDDIIDLFE